MEFVTDNKGLTLKPTEEELEILRMVQAEGTDLNTDNAMFDFFEGILANCEWEWISPEEIGALTDAPILGYRDCEEEVVRAFGFMDYAIDSLLNRLLEAGEAHLIGGS
jgi:hypothetical protein